MSNYTKTTNFTLKDSLPPADPAKVVRGSEFDVEFDNIATAIASKADSGSGGGGGLAAVVDDTTPQLGGNLDVNGNSIVSASNGNIALSPNGSGTVIIDGLTYPSTDGTDGQALTTDGAGALSFTAVISDVVDDTSPELGGDLNLNTNNITGVGEINTDGDVTINTDTFKVDISTSRVGILNATPDVSLDIGSATDAMHIPSGTTAQRPTSPSEGYIRYNSDEKAFEGYTDKWGNIEAVKDSTYYKKHFDGMELIAHRGFRTQFPQNTLLAMSSALSSGADSLECDVQVSSDGVLYLFHDTTVDALTNGTGTFTTLSSSTINSLQFDALSGTYFEDEPIPTFADFLTLAKRSNTYVYPEIKKYRTQADITLIVNAIVAAGMEDRCLLQSFVYSDLEYVRNINSNIALGFLGSSTTQATYEGHIDDLQNLGRASLLWNYSSLLSTPAIITYARDRNVDIGTWTVNSDVDATNLLDLGVTKIMSDITLGGR